MRDAVPARQTPVSDTGYGLGAGGSLVVVCGVADQNAESTVLGFAARLVEHLGGRLVFLHLQPPPLIVSEPRIAYAAPEFDAAANLGATAGRLVRMAAGAGVASRTQLRVGFGDLEKRLVATARSEAAALVVVGSGSLAARLVRRAADLAVVAVPLGAPGFDARIPGTRRGRQPMAGADPQRDAGLVARGRGGDVVGSIVCGIDGSEDARIALRAAAQLAEQLGLRLVGAHVVQARIAAPGPGAMSPAVLGAPTGELLEAGRAVLDRALDAEGVAEAERRVVYGFPSDSLADLADEEDAELIVVGSRGRGALKAAFLGSVSSELIGVARRPVLVVPRAATLSAIANRHPAVSAEQPPSGA